MSYYMHNVPGRLRVKSPLLKRNAGAAEELKKTLSTMPGIAAVDFNPTTGSLLINYNHKAASHQDIVRLLERKGYFDSTKASTNEQYINTAAEKTGRVIGKAALGLAVEKAFEGTALSLLALLL